MRAVAAALTRLPGVPYQQLAEIVGVSRRTLYRLAPSREALLDLLLQQAEAATVAAMKKACLATSPPVEALTVLTREFIADAELYGFWVSEKWNERARQEASGDADPFYDNYRDGMIAFFARGQAEGVFSTGISPEWMIAAYDALLQSPTFVGRQNAPEPLSPAEMIMRIFLRGTAA